MRLRRRAIPLTSTRTSMLRKRCAHLLFMIFLNATSFLYTRHESIPTFTIIILTKNDYVIHTLNSTLEGMGLAGKVNSFSTPPVSFQCISRLVGGARSNVVTISDVLLSWFFISSPDIFFTSSTISLRLRFVFVIPGSN